MSIFNGAKNIAGLIKNAFSEIVLVGGTAAQTVKDILKDLIANIKTIVKGITTPSSSDEVDHFVVRRGADFDLLKEKLKKCKYHFDLNRFCFLNCSTIVFKIKTKKIRITQLTTLEIWIFNKQSKSFFFCQFKHKYTFTLVKLRGLDYTIYFKSDSPFIQESCAQRP